MSALVSKLLWASFSFCLFLPIQGCGKNELGRSEAKDKLSAALKLPRTITVDVHKVVKAEEIEKLGSMASMHYYESVGELQKSPLLKISQINSPYRVFPGFQFELTEAGKKYLTNDPNGINVRACEIKMLEVTGIQFDGDKRKAEVEYEIFIEANAFVKLFQLNNNFEIACASVADTRSVESVTKRQVRKNNMALFDDGWRVVK